MPVSPEFGVLIVVLIVLNTAVGAVFAARNKHLSRRSKRLSRLEPAHLDALDWIYQVRRLAAARGWTGLPKLPESVSTLYLEEAETEELPLELTIKTLQAVRRREEDNSAP